MKSKAVAFLLKWVVKYLKDHPEILKEVSDKIPGTLDDAALRMISKLLGV